MILIISPQWGNVLYSCLNFLRNSLKVKLPGFFADNEEMQPTTCFVEVDSFFSILFYIVLALTDMKNANSPLIYQLWNSPSLLVKESILDSTTLYPLDIFILVIGLLRVPKSD